MSLRHVYPVREAAGSCLVVVALLLVGTAGCTRDATSKPEAPKTESSPTAAHVPEATGNPKPVPTPEPAQTETAAAPPTDAPRSKVPTKPTTEPSRVALAQILISFQGAMNQPFGVSRTKEEAKTRAEEAKAMARKPETLWEDAVDAFSDAPDAMVNGGKMGILDEHQRRNAGKYAAMGDAVFGMEIDQVSEVVESPLGYHVVTRTEIIEYAVSHILVEYQGSKSGRTGITRTKEEAKARAKEALARARAKNADFAALAKEYSDDRSRRKGGDLGVLVSGEIEFGPEFEHALETMKIGEITGPAETEWGFHVIRRDKIDRVGASHILISYTGSQRANPSMTRSKEEALKLAEQVSAEAKAPSADFAELAKKHSDGPNGPYGGVIGLIERGQVPILFEKAVFALEIDGIAGPVETPFGYHIILRTE
jgi:peptidyl-prolyl cis-trans isomerase SurA